jgi:hypothetical protein
VAESADNVEPAQKRRGTQLLKTYLLIAVLIIILGLCLWLLIAPAVKEAFPQLQNSM